MANILDIKPLKSAQYFQLLFSFIFINSPISIIIAIIISVFNIKFLVDVLFEDLHISFLISKNIPTFLIWIFINVIILGIFIFKKNWYGFSKIYIIGIIWWIFFVFGPLILELLNQNFKIYGLFFDLIMLVISLISWVVLFFINKKDWNDLDKKNKILQQEQEVQKNIKLDQFRNDYNQLSFNH
jgi:hypothetical protein